MAYLGINPNTPLLNTSTQTFSGNSATTEFTLNRAVASASDLDVMIGSTMQRPFTDYTAGNTTLLFTSAPGTGTNNITVTYRGGALNSLDLTASVFNSGTEGNPSVYSLAGDNTGIYWPTSSSMAVTVQGSDRATFNGNATSVDNTTGALVVAGGVGITGNVNATGFIVTTNSTESSSVYTGAMQIGGGAGIVGNLNIGGDITCVGDFTVNGTFTTTGTDSLEVNDPFIFLANANPGDTYDTGVVSQYFDGTNNRYTGYFRDITDNKYKLFGNLLTKPSTTVDTGNVSFQYQDLVLANVSATGNVNGAYFVGNGSALTGISTDTTQIVNGTSKVIIPSLNGNIDANVTGSTIATIWSGGIVVTGGLTTTTTIAATGNLSGGNINTAGAVSAGGNIVTSTGNISGGNLLTGGLIAATATITGGNLATAGTASAGGNITGGNLRTGGLISATGDIYGDDIISTTLAATGNVTGGNVISSGVVTTVGDVLSGAAVSAVGNITGGNLNSPGLANVTGNIIGGNINTSGQLISSKIGSAATGSGQLYLNGTGNNRIDFNTNGTGAPTFTTRSAGAKVTLYPNLGVSAADYALGIEAGALWSGVPDSSGQFKWYAGTTQVGSLSGAGALSAAGNITGANINTAGIVSSGGNVIGGNLTTGGQVVATGNITGGNLLTSGTGGNITGANVVSATTFNGTTVSMAGNVTGGNVISTAAISAGGLILATGNITGGNLITNGAISAGGLVSATGNVTGGNINTAGLVSSTGNVTNGIANVLTGNLIATTLVSGATLTGTTLSATGNVIGGNLNATGLSLSGNVVSGLSMITAITTTANITGGNILGGANVNATTHTGATVSVTGNVTSGNILTGGLISATGGITGSSFTGSGSGLTSIPAGNLSGTTLNSGVVTSSLTTVGALNSGSITSGFGAIDIGVDSITCGSIVNANANGVGNIGSSTVYFNTVFGKATTAQYADLAENYIGDTTYAPGTVLDFGGSNEVTLSVMSNSTRVAGVVSTNPAHLMNGMVNGNHVIPLALTGRVPTSVVGTVRKGDMMVSAGNGQAQACATPVIGSVIGKALENFDGEAGVIEVVVGRL